MHDDREAGIGNLETIKRQIVRYSVASRYGKTVNDQPNDRTARSAGSRDRKKDEPGKLIYTI